MWISPINKAVNYRTAEFHAVDLAAVLGIVGITFTPRYARLLLPSSWCCAIPQSERIPETVE